jgi:streptogramin lyase
MLLRADPRTGVIEKLYDMSIDQAEHNPIVMTRRGNRFFVGTFGEDGGPAELALFDKDFTGYTLPFQSLNPIVGLVWSGNRLYGVEMFPYDNQWAPDSANLVKFDPRTGARSEVLTGFASYPGSLVQGPDGALYTSNEVISATTGGVGSVLRIVP